jgi:hypothetical protein
LELDEIKSLKKGSKILGPSGLYTVTSNQSKLDQRIVNLIKRLDGFSPILEAGPYINTRRTHFHEVRTSTWSAPELRSSDWTLFNPGISNLSTKLDLDTTKTLLDSGED